MADTSWMSIVCEPDNERLGGLVTHPWSLNWHGERYSVATNGRILLAIRDNESTHPPATDRHCAAITKHLDRSGTPIGDTDVGTLREWVGTPQEAKEVPCRRCHGKGEIDCDCCDTPLALDCDECDGDGKIRDEIEVRSGWVGSVLINRSLLAPVLPHLSGPCRMEDVRFEDSTFIQKDQSAVLLIGKEWRVLLIGMIPGSDNKDDARFDLNVTRDIAALSP